MANTKISMLPAAMFLTGTEEVAIVQGAATVKCTVDDIKDVVVNNLPSFFTDMRSLSVGNDAPVNVFASDLTSYVVDITEAQDLLNAAQQYGTVSDAITYLLYPSSIPVYANLHDVITAGLPDGTLWRISWVGDTYIADGSIIGTIYNGVPTWEGRLPTSKTGPIWSVISVVGSGAVSYDPDGRPILSAPGVNSSAKIGLNYSIAKPYQVGATAMVRHSAAATLGFPPFAQDVDRTDSGSNRIATFIDGTSGGDAILKCYSTTTGTFSGATIPAFFNGVSKEVKIDLLVGARQGKIIHPATAREFNLSAINYGIDGGVENGGDWSGDVNVWNPQWYCGSQPGGGEVLLTAIEVSSAI